MLLLIKDKYYHYYFVSNLYLDTEEVYERVEEKILEGEAELVIPFVYFSGDKSRLSNEAEYYDQSYTWIHTLGPKDKESRFSGLLRCKSEIGIPELEIKYDSYNDEVPNLLTQIIYSIRKEYVESFLNPTKTWLSEYREVDRLRALYEVIYVYLTLISTSWWRLKSHSCTLKSPEERRKPDLNKFLSSIQSFFRKLEVGWISGLNGNKETFTLTKDQDEIYSNTCPEYSPHRLLTIDGDNWSNSLISFIKKDLISSEGALPFDKIGIIDSNFACVFWKFVESTSLFIEGDLWDGYKISEVLEAAERLDICLDIIYENEGNYILRLPEGVVGEKASSNIYFSDLSTLTNLENLSEEWSNTKEYWSSVYSTLVSYFNKYNHIRDTVFKQTFKKPKDGEKDKRKMAFNLMSSFSYDGDAMPLVLEKEDLKSIIRLAKYFSGNVELNLSNYVPTSNMTTINPELLIDKIQELFKVDRLLIALVAVFIVTT